jgi:hypothetical protein
MVLIEDQLDYLGEEDVFSWIEAEFKMYAYHQGFSEESSLTGWNMVMFFRSL